MKTKTPKLTPKQKAQVLGNLPFGFTRKPNGGIQTNPNEQIKVLLDQARQLPASVNDGEFHKLVIPLVKRNLLLWLPLLVMLPEQVQPKPGSTNLELFLRLV